MITEICVLTLFPLAKLGHVIDCITKKFPCQVGIGLKNTSLKKVQTSASIWFQSLKADLENGY